MQCPDAGHEAVLTSLRGDEAGYARHALAYRSARDCEGPGAIVSAAERVLLLVKTHKVAVVLPRRLEELELAVEVRVKEAEQTASLRAVVFGCPLGQHRA